MDVIVTTYNFVTNESSWFPVSLDGRQFSSADLRRSKPGTTAYIPTVWELNWSMALAVLLVVFRYLLERYIVKPLGYKCGVKRLKPVHLQPNPILEAVYTKQRGATLDDFTYKGLTKQLDMSVRQIDRWLRKRKRSDTSQPIIKFCDSSWHLMFYSLAFTYGLAILWNKPWLWKTKECWTDWPTHTLTSDLYWYYMVELAFYWSLIFTVFTDRERKDFWEYIIHHVSTMVLMYASWAAGFTRMGSLILLLHDAADPFIALAKLSIYINAQRLADVSFAAFVLVWIPTRLIYLPFWIIYSAQVELYEIFSKAGLIIRVCNIFLYALMFLHLNWSYNIGKLVFSVLGKGKVRDTRSDSEGEDDLSDENDNNLANEELATPTNGTLDTPCRNGALDTPTNCALDTPCRNGALDTPLCESLGTPT